MTVAEIRKLYSDLKARLLCFEISKAEYKKELKNLDRIIKSLAGSL